MWRVYPPAFRSPPPPFPPQCHRKSWPLRTGTHRSKRRPWKPARETTSPNRRERKQSGSPRTATRTCGNPKPNVPKRRKPCPEGRRHRKRTARIRRMSSRMEKVQGKQSGRRSRKRHRREARDGTLLSAVRHGISTSGPRKGPGSTPRYVSPLYTCLCCPSVTVCHSQRVVLAPLLLGPLAFTVSLAALRSGIPCKFCASHIVSIFATVS